jgi:hypothetical protein
MNINPVLAACVAASAASAASLAHAGGDLRGSKCCGCDQAIGVVIPFCCRTSQCRPCPINATLYEGLT